jgi:two-component system alkaline phosphatase synthesis response regulator PhoP
MTRILIVDDEKNLRDVLRLSLEMEGYEVRAISDGLDILPLLETEHFDLILLDIMMPERSGFEVFEQLKIHFSEIPVIFLTARDAAKDKIKGLKQGAADYITKPFNTEELLLRIKNATKHSLRENHTMENELSVYHFGDNWIDFDRFLAYGNGEEIRLSNKEIKLLRYLIGNKNDVLSRQQILQYVWGYDVFPSTRTIDNFILSFRKYFEKDQRDPLHFHSIRGVGYKFTE